MYKDIKNICRSISQIHLIPKPSTLGPSCIELTMGPFIYVLGTQPRQNVLGTCSRYTSVHITSTVKCSRYPFVQVENGMHLSLRSMTYCVYTAQRVRSFWCPLSVLIAVCVLSPAHLVHCSRYTSVHTCFGCVLRGAICSENMVWPCSSWNCSSGNNSL